MTESTVPRVQRKVAVFITRRLGEGTEIALTWHAGGGHQLPAGTVETGESFSAAALREVAEETGLEIARLTGWVPSDQLARSQRRRFLLAVSRDQRTRPWHLEGEPGMDFTVAWHPLDRRPTLIPGHEEWLARYATELGSGT